MKVTKAELKKIIKEEISKVLSEDDFGDYAATAGHEADCAKLSKGIDKAVMNAKSLEAYQGMHPAGPSEYHAAWEHVGDLKIQYKAKCKGTTSAHDVAIPVSGE